MLEIADKRGLPLAFPLLDTTDLQGVTFSDIWGGFDERIINASKRYDANSILIGRIRPASSQRNRWTYVFGDESRTWTGPPEAIVAQVADMLAAEFAVGGDTPLEKVALNRVKIFRRTLLFIKELKFGMVQIRLTAGL